MPRTTLTLVIAIGLACAATQTADAQAYQPTYQPPGAPGAGAAHPEVPRLSLTWNEYKLLQRGEISPTAHVAGGVLGTFFGYGIGHLVQGRYGEIGWKFTVGEVASLSAFIIGLSSCVRADLDDGRGSSPQTCHVGLMIGGILGYAGFRIWEIADVWSAPPKHNRKVRNLRYRLRYHRPTIYLSKSSDTGSNVAGVSLRF